MSTEPISNPPPTRPNTVSARISPAASGLDVLSRHEVARLRDAGAGGLHELLRRCALAVLTQGSVSDDARALLERYPDFDVQILQQDRGVKLELINAPADASSTARSSAASTSCYSRSCATSSTSPRRSMPAAST